jgi:hypothetical protein
MLLIRWFSIKIKTSFWIFPVLTSSNRPALIAIGEGDAEGDGDGEGVWASNGVIVKRETASAIAPIANRVLFIRRAENDQTLLTQSEGEKSKA